MVEPRVFTDPEELAEAAAVEATRVLREAVRERGVATLVLAGGSTPRRLYQRLSAEPWRSRIDWSSLAVYFGDERCVPPDDPASNYRMAREALLERVPIPERSIHRIAGELEPAAAAARYEGVIGRTVGEESPRFDLVLLGMGADGHTASLFPGRAALAETERLVVATTAPVSPVDRVTLTLPVLNGARAVLFLVQGEDKAPALRAVAEAETLESTPPAGRVRPVAGELQWLVDRSARGVG